MQAWLILQIFQSRAAGEREARALMLWWISLFVCELQRDCCAEARNHLKPNRSNIKTEFWLCCRGIPGLITQLLLQSSGLERIFSSSFSISKNTTALLNICLWMYMHMCLYICVCVYAYVCIYTHYLQYLHFILCLRMLELIMIFFAARIGSEI